MSRSRPTYKKPSRVYDYNYNLGEHYYKPLLQHAELRSHGRAGSPPKAKTFAERFAEDPIYGSYGTAGYGTLPRKTSLTDELFGRTSRPSERFATRTGPSEDTEFGRSRINPNDEFGDFGKSRFSFGDRLLDAAGAGAGARGQGSSRFGSGRNESEPRGFRGLEDPFDDEFFQSRAGKRLGKDGNTRAAAEDFLNEDSFKTKSGRRFDASATADELMDEMKREADKFGEASKLRSKLRTNRQEDLDFGTANEALPESTEAKIERIRARAKARIAEAMEDDFQLAPTQTKSYFDDFDSTPATTGGTKSVRISKRSVKTTFDTD